MAESRTTAIAAAVAHQLEQRRTFLDRAEDLGELIVTVRLHAGTTRISSVEVREHHISRRTYDPMYSRAAGK